MFVWKHFWTLNSIDFFLVYLQIWLGYNVMKCCGIIKYELIIGLMSVFWQICIIMSLGSCVVYPAMLVTGLMAGYTADLGCWGDVQVV